jgi:hypothetical protein
MLGSKKKICNVHPGSRFFSIPDRGAEKAPDPGSATLLLFATKIISNLQIILSKCIPVPYSRYKKKNQLTRKKKKKSIKLDTCVRNSAKSPKKVKMYLKTCLPSEAGGLACFNLFSSFPLIPKCYEASLRMFSS